MRRGISPLIAALLATAVLIALVSPGNAGEYAGPGYDSDHGYNAGGYDPYYRRYPGWRCAYGPIYQRRVCDWSRRYCWKERECYYIDGRKYCRYYTRCDGARRHCYWVPNHGYRSCHDRYD